MLGSSPGRRDGSYGALSLIVRGKSGEQRGLGQVSMREKRRDETRRSMAWHGVASVTVTKVMVGTVKVVREISGHVCRGGWLGDWVRWARRKRGGVGGGPSAAEAWNKT